VPKDNLIYWHILSKPNGPTKHLRYPDFATIYITYIPDERVVELKALKLYINSYRDRYISHEESANQILDDFVAVCDPLEVTVKADFTPRGNVHTVIEVRHQKS
jgi:7-cyano-7-deazaguanine reductase